MSKFQSPTNHHMKRRAVWHDYSLPGTYHITLVIKDRIQLFGSLVSSPSPHIELSELGNLIVEKEMAKIHRIYPNVEIWGYAMMPDHIHMILHVSEPFSQKRHLGNVVYGFKTGCTRAWWELEERRLGGSPHASQMPGGKTPGTVAPCRNLTAAPSPLQSLPSNAPSRPSPSEAHREPSPSEAPQEPSPSGPGQGATVPEGFPSGSRPLPAKGAREGKPAKPVLFEEGYNDGVLLNQGQLERWKLYLLDNPRRLAIKRLHPDYFHVLHDIDICGRKCQIVGNRFLLNIPDKMLVVVHRADSDEAYEDCRRRWLACGERGGVLVSAAIARREKTVMREAMDRGYRIILLRENGFPEMYKPSGEAFDACSEGRLLQISPWEFHFDRRSITRSQCLNLNSFGEMIVNDSKFY